MSPVWVVPFLVAAVGGAGLLALLRGTAESTRELAAEVARFGELHASLARVHQELRRGQQTIGRLGDL